MMIFFGIVSLCLFIAYFTLITKKDCPFCMKNIPKSATVCPFCGKDLPVEKAKNYKPILYAACIAFIIMFVMILQSPQQRKQTPVEKPVSKIENELNEHQMIIDNTLGNFADNLKAQVPNIHDAKTKGDPTQASIVIEIDKAWLETAYKTKLDILASCNEAFKTAIDQINIQYRPKKYNVIITVQGLGKVAEYDSQRNFSAIYH